MRVYVLLFNAGTDNEGIHTIQIGDRNKVLMFESEDDAMRYALLLEAQDFGSPTAEIIDSEEIEAFCQKADYDWEIIKSGELAIPPEKNVDKSDWELEKAENSSDETMSPSELDKIRRQLEGLL
ncbi:MAG: DUF3110 domain-containing protein [Cyanobacteria bacterium J083]|nr:MAG: DUF3110 domain-containing protein [Cyanobacteria bacterium J083]